MRKSLKNCIHLFNNKCDDNQSNEILGTCSQIMENLKNLKIHEFSTVILRNITDSELIYLNYINHLSFNFNWLNIDFVNKLESNNESLNKFFQFKHFCYHDLNIWSCYIEKYIEMNSKITLPILFSRINIMHHSK